MQPGRWRITARAEMPGMPVAMPAVTRITCYSEKDIADNKTVPATRPDCTREYYRVRGNTVSWKMTCRGRGKPATMTGSITSTGTSYEGKMITESASGKMVTILSGTRIGSCN